ncbi:MAG: MBL fold metallo-hydrolase [Planctomycetes bacterium]|nr:MBL fold metallo-hydrolase [Planctomycetota bacterium]MBL7186437.1 MBL fold metallo-hydrolase [Phycisphaerae bacterium]
MSEYVCITTLVEDTVSGTGLSSEHGLSFWIEYGNQRVLFDTGQTCLLLKNARILGADVAKADAIVLSHGHYDHTGGLAAVLDIAPRVTVYAHPAAIRPKFSRKGTETRAIGMSGSTRQVVLAHAQDERVVWTEEPAEVMPGLFVTGRIPRITDFEDVGGAFYVDENCETADILPDDQAMFFDTPRGLVVLLGCSHAGVVNTLDYIVKLSGDKHIDSVVGGMHLLNASQDRIQRTVNAFSKYNVQNIGFGHCTGANTAQGIRSAFPGRCFTCSTGSRARL